MASNIIGATVDSSVVNEYENRISRHSTKIDSIKNLISSTEKRVDSLKRAESSSLSQLNSLEKNIALSQELVDELSIQVDSVTADTEKSRKLVDSLVVEVDSRREIMEKRLRDIYKRGTPSIIAIILGSSSPTDILYRIRFAQDIANYDKRILSEITKNQSSADEQLALLTLQNDHLREMLIAKQSEYNELKLKVDSRKELIASIRGEKKKWSSTVKELKAAQREMNSLIENLITKRDKAYEAVKKSKKYNFAKRKGELIWPIHGKIVSNYGKQIHPIHKTVTTNKGIGIAGKKGTSVKAVAPGVVEYVGRLPGYGLVLIINHFGGYMTIYAHLGSTLIKRKVEVSTGTTIATVGESGSLSGTQLYFEIRDGRKSVNPIDWLLDR